MDHPIEKYWEIRLKDIKGALEENNFEAFIAKDGAQARQIALEEIIPPLQPKTISWGGSVTFIATGLYQAIKESAAYDLIDTYEKDLSAEEATERRRQSLLVDLFIAGTNAITESGQLVNLDMIGNRLGGITFGPKNVILFVGRNKITADLDEAMFRIKNYAAPTNVLRLDKKTPCSKTSYCEECKSPDRICNTWAITEKSFPKGRIKVVLINDDMGL